jgi:hypothetical protein
MNAILIWYRVYKYLNFISFPKGVSSCGKDFLSAVICPTATKFNGILVGRFNLYCHITNICL